MALLQLAESPYTALAESNVMSNYIFIPAGMFGQVEDTYVREDFFDSLTDQEYQEVITALAPYQNQGMSAVGLVVAGGVKAIAPIVKNAVQKRAQRVASGQAKPIFKPDGKISNLIGKAKTGKLKDKITGAINKLKTKSTGAEDKVPVDISGDIGGTSFDLTTGQPQAEPFFTKYKTPLLIVGGLAGAFLLYKAIKKK